MNRSKIMRGVAFWSLLAAIGLTYFGSPVYFFRHSSQKAPDGYYGALTDAFLSGQLNLKIDPDPRLLNSPNPYLPQMDVPRVHDASLYRGKYYLYFGAAPVLLLYLPWRVATGYWLSEAHGTVLFCFAGVLLSALFLRRARDRYFSACGYPWLLSGVAVVAWASPVYYLAQNGTFYAVPIACAFLCITLVVVSTERALSADSEGGACRWIAAASAAYGLAIASRPDYAFGLPFLLLPGLVLCMRRREGGKVRWKALVAAIVPCAAVGAGIAAYNFCRFGNPLEFGMRFALMGAGGDMRNAQLLGAQYLKGNIGSYLFRPAHYIRYFPYLLVDGTYGMLRYLPLAALGILVLAVYPLGLRGRVPAAPLITCVLLLGIAACNLFSLGLFYYFGEIRYMADFVPAALLLGVLVALGLVDRAGSGGRGSGTLYVAIAGLTAVTLVNGCLANLGAAAQKGGMASLVQKLDSVVSWYETRTGKGQGPLEITLRFPKGSAGVREPLVTTGTEGHADILYIEYLANRRARLGMFHEGSGGPTGNEFELTPGVHTLRISMGSLYPPRGHPLFKGYPGKSVDALKRQLAVALDGRTLLEASRVFYFATPDLVFVGANPRAANVSLAAFSGEILAARRLGLPPASELVGPPGARGPLRLVVRFPRGRNGRSEPLVCTGRPGAGNVFYVTYVDERRVRFALDSLGKVVVTPSVEVDLDREHTIDLEMGSLYPPDAGFAGLSAAEANRAKHRYSVRLDGRLLALDHRIFQPSESDEVICGLDTVGAGSVDESFSGSIVFKERIDAPPEGDAPAWGPLNAWVLFPPNREGQSEPLAVTGAKGRGDLVFVRYVDSGHVRFGFDHWFAGGPVGPSVPIDFSKPHHLEVTMGSLYPADEDAEWLKHPEARKHLLKSNVRVTLDGTVMLAAELPTYDVSSDQISLWANLIEGSSCGETFTGRVISELRDVKW